MFTNMRIRKLEEKGYTVLTPEESEVFDNMDTEIMKLRRDKTKITKKYNNLLKEIVMVMTIKDMKANLAANGVTEVPSKKAELIDLYVKTFQE